MKNECCEGDAPPGMGWRVGLSILVFFGWLIFLVVWLFFFAGRFTLLENLGIVIVAFLVGVAILAASWASWGMKYGKKMEKWGKHMEREYSYSAPEARATPARKKARTRKK